MGASWIWQGAASSAPTIREDLSHLTIWLASPLNLAFSAPSGYPGDEGKTEKTVERRGLLRVD
ncbi:MAG: hypothetical protein C3F12_12960 [Candidatus Methylomirabilota bacterium]|nr:MAG: hypothetical protein C3F12_12960 [candidate division NC10 bacterium]